MSAPITQDVLTIPRKLPEGGKTNIVGLPRAALRILSANGLQAQLRAVVLLALAAGWFALRHLDWNVPLPEMRSRELVFALLWIVGGACAIGAAWQAKYHRFAALIVLKAPDVPSVLFETGYLSNEADATFIFSKDGRESIAAGTARAIETHFAKRTAK